MHTRSFSFAAVMVAVTGRQFIGPIEECRELAAFLTGKDIDDVAFEKDLPEARTELFKQFPQLDSPEFHFAHAELVAMLDQAKDTMSVNDKKLLVTGWLVKVSAQYNIGVNADNEVNQPVEITSQKQLQHA